MIGLSLTAHLFRQLGTWRWPLLWLANAKYSVAVNAFITDAEGCVWLQQHRFWEDTSWGLPGGFLRAGEDPQAGLIREVAEETGLTVSKLALRHSELFYRYGLMLCFTGIFLPGELHLDRTELLDGRFFPLDQLPQPILPSHRALLMKLAGLPQVEG